MQAYLIALALAALPAFGNFTGGLHSNIHRRICAVCITFSHPAAIAARHAD